MYPKRETAGALYETPCRHGLPTLSKVDPAHGVENKFCRDEILDEHKVQALVGACLVARRDKRRVRCERLAGRARLVRALEGRGVLRDAEEDGDGDEDED